MATTTFTPAPNMNAPAERYRVETDEYRAFESAVKRASNRYRLIKEVIWKEGRLTVENMDAPRAAYFAAVKAASDRLLAVAEPMRWDYDTQAYI